MLIKKYYKLVRVSHEDSEYLRITNISNEAGNFSILKQGSPNPQYAPNLEYSLDCVNWNSYDFSTLPTVLVSPGSNIYFRGNNTTSARFNQHNSNSNYWNFHFDKNYNLYGCISSLITKDPNDFSTITTINSFAFYSLFRDETNLINSYINTGNIQSIDENTFTSFFYGCTNLVTAGDFSSITTLVYGSNFTQAFTNTKITEGIDLTNITTVPTLAIGNMYFRCTKLTKAYAPNIQDLTDHNILSGWLQSAGTDVPAGTTKEVYVPAGATISTNSDNGIPTGWTRVDY